MGAYFRIQDTLMLSFQYLLPHPSPTFTDTDSYFPGWHQSINLKLTVFQVPGLLTSHSGVARHGHLHQRTTADYLCWQKFLLPHTVDSCMVPFHSLFFLPAFCAWLSLGAGEPSVCDYRAWTPHKLCRTSVCFLMVLITHLMKFLMG